MKEIEIRFVPMLAFTPPKSPVGGLLWLILSEFPPAERKQKRAKCRIKIISPIRLKDKKLRYCPKLAAKVVLGGFYFPSFFAFLNYNQSFSTMIFMVTR
jgi:ribonucleotide reductase beta subunit family protein with ferritin-like domain